MYSVEKQEKKSSKNDLVIKADYVRYEEVLSQGNLFTANWPAKSDFDQALMDIWLHMSFICCGSVMYVPHMIIQFPLHLFIPGHSSVSTLMVRGGHIIWKGNINVLYLC